MGFLSSIAGFLSNPIVGTIGSIATGLLGQKGANDRNEQQIAMTREQMAWQERMSNTAKVQEVHRICLESVLFCGTPCRRKV